MTEKTNKAPPLVLHDPVYNGGEPAEVTDERLVITLTWGSQQLKFKRHFRQDVRFQADLPGGWSMHFERYNPFPDSGRNWSSTLICQGKVVDCYYGAPDEQTALDGLHSKVKETMAHVLGEK